jgi:hypothetical protein
MAKIRLVKKKTNEMSGTGGSASATPGTGAQYAAPKAFPKVAADYNKTFGTHFAPSIPNRPSEAITYKELWEAGEYDSLASILKQLGAEEDSIKVLLKAVEMGALKPSDAIIITKRALGMKEGYGEFDMEDDGPDYNSISDLEDELRRLVRWSNQYGSKGADGKIEQLRKRIEYLKSQSVNENTDVVVATLNNPQLDPDVKKLLFKGYKDGHLTADKVVSIVKSLLMTEETSDDADFDSATTGANGLQTMNPLPIKEGRYSEFKRTTQVRTPSEQMHRAVREIRRKIDEINKLVDYTEKMKFEMKSDVNEVRYLNRTKEALSKISAKVQETNNKIKRLVQ